MESGRSSRPSRRRRSGRRRPPTPPTPSQNDSRRSLHNGSSNGQNGLPSQDSSWLFPRSSAPANRAEGLAPLARRRPLRSPRPDSQFSLRRLLDEPNRNNTNGRRRPGEENGALSKVRPIHPTPAKNLSLPQTVIPLQARPIHPGPHGAENNAPGSRRKRRRAQKPPTPLIYITRLVIFGVGVGAIVGTILSIWTPVRSPFTAAGTAAGSQAAEARTQPATALPERLFRPDGAPPPQNLAPMATRLKQPLAPLAAQIQPLITQAPDLKAGVFIVDLDSGNFVDINGDMAVSAASTIKVPILVGFLQDVDTGKVRLDEALTMQPTDVTTGSGELQYMEPGSTFSSLETATKMIVISDNTATNMVMNRIGGAEGLNQRFRGWGLTHTVIHSPLADLQGTNTTSARDLSMILTAVAQGDLLSLRSRDRLLEIMRGTVTDTLIPAGVGPGALVAHKTGTIDSMVGDTGIVDMPNGKRYIITVLVQRSTDDGRAQELARQISQITYQFFSQPPAAAIAPAQPQPAPPPAANPSQPLAQ